MTVLQSFSWEKVVFYSVHNEYWWKLDFIVKLISSWESHLQKLILTYGNNASTVSTFYCFFYNRSLRPVSSRHKSGEFNKLNKNTLTKLPYEKFSTSKSNGCNQRLPKRKIIRHSVRTAKVFIGERIESFALRCQQPNYQLTKCHFLLTCTYTIIA